MALLASVISRANMARLGALRTVERRSLTGALQLQAWRCPSIATASLWPVAASHRLLATQATELVSKPFLAKSPRGNPPRGLSDEHVLMHEAGQPISNSILARIWDGTYPHALSKISATLEDKEVTSLTRWNMLLRGLLIQIPGGAIYTWSMWQGPLATAAGVVAPAAMDWGFSGLALTFPFLAVGYGAAFGPLAGWIERCGPRYAAVVGASIYGFGHLVAALGVYVHYLPLIWIGWGLLGGFGSGLGFIAPMSTLMRWFPDKKGFATGVSIGAYASGSMIMAPIIDKLLSDCFRPPIYAGAANAVEVKTEAGRQLVSYKGNWEEAVFGASADLAKLPDAAAADLLEGFYLVGTGSTGVTMCLAACGTLYTACMLSGAMLMRTPPPEFQPEGMAVKTNARSELSSKQTGIVAAGDVPISAALRSPQFWMLWLSLSCSCTAGAAVLANSKIILVDVFTKAYPTVVTGAFTSAFVGLLGLFNAGGRVGWASLSDKLGRQRTLALTCLSAPACLVIPQLAPLALSGQDGLMPLITFCGASCFIVSCYGGVIALMPSYTSDLFGSKDAGVIYGWVMTGWTTSAILGPSSLAVLRQNAETQAIEKLVTLIPPSAFEQTFKAPASELQSLVNANTVTVPRLLEIVPAGTLDPTPHLYDSTFYSLATVITAAALSNGLIRRVDPSLYVESAGEDEFSDEPAR